MAELVIKLVNGELAGQTLQSLNKELRTAKLEADKAKIGTQEWIDAHKKLDGAVGKMSDYKKEVGNVTKASDSLRTSFMSVLDKIPGFSAISGALSSAKTGVGGLTSGFGLLKGAIAATGIGLLVLAIAALVGWFTKTDAGATMISSAFKALGNVVDVLYDKIWNIGKTLKEFFSDPIQFFKNLGNDIADAATEGWEFEEVLDAIQDQARELEVQNAETQKAVEQLLIQSKNVGLSYKERIDLLDRAGKLETENHEHQLANAIALENLRQQDFDRAKERGTETDEMDQALKDAQVARINLERESINLQEKIANRRTVLLENQSAEEQRLADQKKKRLEQEVKDETDAVNNIEALRVEKMTAGMDKEIAMLQLNTTRKIAALKGSDERISEQRKLLQEIQEQEIQAIRDKYSSEAAQKSEADLLQANELRLSTELNLINEEWLSKEITEQMYREQSMQLALDFEAQKLAIVKAARGENSIEYQREYATFLKMQKASADASIEITKNVEKERLKDLSNGLAVTGNIFGNLASLYEQGTQDWKNFAIAQAVISTIQGSINAFTGALALPAPFGEILAPIAAAAALAAGYAQVRKIENTKVSSPAKAERGMVLSGPSHSSGGIPIEAEGDEIILTKGVYRNPGLRSWASAINVAGGGRSFEAGGPTNPFDASRGPIGRGDETSLPGLDNTAVVKKLDQLILSMDSRIDRIVVTNNLQETEKGLKVLQRLKDEASW